MLPHINSSTSASTISVGMDVHKRTIALCAYNARTGVILDERGLPHDLPKVTKYLRKVQDRHGQVRSCYEASSCGFGLQRALQARGISCEVIAPSSIPRRPGERVKTDRRDAKKLATLYAAGLLTIVCIPDEEQEAIRSLLRCRGDLAETITRTKQRILTFLQTRGLQYPGKTNWTKTFHTWIGALPMAEIDQITLQTYLHQLDQLTQEVRRIEGDLAAQAERAPYQAPVKVLMAFRGIGLVTALTLVFELGDLRRFAHPRQLMAYLGLVPSEHSSGNHTQRGGLTKTGNVHVRNAVISAAWKYATPPRRSRVLRQRQEAISAEVISVAWKAQRRLYKRFHKLSQTKARCVANAAVARELVGFLWEALRLENPLITTRARV